MTDPKRDNFGRPLIIPPEGGKPVAYRRCTTFIKALDGDSFNLEQWAKRHVAVGLSKRPDLMTLVAASYGPDDRKLDEICESAKDAAGGNIKRNWGTAIHTVTERIDKGGTPVIPAEMEKDIQAYLAAVKPFEMVRVEGFVVNDELKVGGTFDRLVRIDGKTHVADLKSGSLQGPSAAAQIAIYANSHLYNVETGERTPLGADLQTGLVFHLPMQEGKCVVYVADLVAGWQGAKIAADVWAWRAKKGFLK